MRGEVADLVEAFEVKAGDFTATTKAAAAAAAKAAAAVREATAQQSRGSGHMSVPLLH